MINLPDITLIAISSIEIPATIRALLYSSSNINFGAVKLVSHEKPKDLSSEIQFEECPKINNIMDFNHYVFKEFGKHVQTSHCLMIQYHAWICDWTKWNEKWLEYDYGGAGWEYRDDAYICHDTGEHVRVGNGGFSIRSKRILEIPKKYGLPLLSEQNWFNEDGNCCVYHRVKMLELGVKYMPLEEAVHFSFERPIPENQGIRPFGFHRNYPSI